MKEKIAILTSNLQKDIYKRKAKAEGKTIPNGKKFYSLCATNIQTQFHRK